MNHGKRIRNAVSQGNIEFPPSHSQQHFHQGNAKFPPSHFDSHFHHVYSHGQPSSSNSYVPSNGGGFMESENNADDASYDAKLSSQMGRMAKNGSRFPLTVGDWRKIDKYNKEITWLEYKANFSLEDNFKPQFLKKLGNMWKN